MGYVLERDFHKKRLIRLAFSNPGASQEAAEAASSHPASVIVTLNGE
jgi:hypothetical protein